MITEEKELNNIKRNDSFLSFYSDGITSLKRSGIFDFLRVHGRARIKHDGKDIHVMSTEAARASGFNDALDILLNFPDLFLDNARDITTVRMDFNSLERAVEKNDLTKEEADAIRNGTTSSIKYG